MAEWLRETRRGRLGVMKGGEATVCPALARTLYVYGQSKRALGYLEAILWF